MEFKDIPAIVKKFREDIEVGVLPTIARDIEEIIRTEDKSVGRIEGLLDTLLDCMSIGVGEQEFITLNKYYASFNKKNADVYYKFYKEILK